MAVVPFKWYLHDGKVWENSEAWEEALGIPMTKEHFDKLGSPFYEVTLECEFDTETGQVTLVSAKL